MLGRRQSGKALNNSLNGAVFFLLVAGIAGSDYKNSRCNGVLASKFCIFVNVCDEGLVFQGRGGYYNNRCVK